MSTTNGTIDMVVEAKAFCEQYSIKQGWTQEQHIGLGFTAITEALGIEGKEDRVVLLGILSQMVNPSAFRQKLESKGVLAKVDKSGAATELANKYCS